MKDDWRGTPYCDRKTAEFYLEPSKCNHPDMRIGQATPCLKCRGSGMKTIAEELKEHPFNHHAFEERTVKRIADSEVKKTMQWDETKGKHFYTVNNEVIWDWREAREKWIAFEAIKIMLSTKGGLSWLKP